MTKVESNISENNQAVSDVSSPLDDVFPFFLCAKILDRSRFDKSTSTNVSTLIKSLKAGRDKIIFYHCCPRSTFCLQFCRTGIVGISFWRSNWVIHIYIVYHVL